jgi:hypothetical protein
MASAFNNELVAKMADFLNGIGIPVTPATLDETFLPGIKIENQGLLVDEEKLKYPGDILHEAGHIAVAPPSYRKRLSDRIDPQEDFKYAGELMALGWSYAAAVHIGIDPAIVFHPDGYRGQAQQILDGFTYGVSYIGLPVLQWAGMTASGALAEQLGVAPYPHMIRWVREHEPVEEA